MFTQYSISVKGIFHLPQNKIRFRDLKLFVMFRDVVMKKDRENEMVKEETRL